MPLVERTGVEAKVPFVGAVAAFTGPTTCATNVTKDPTVAGDAVPEITGDVNEGS